MGRHSLCVGPFVPWKLAICFIGGPIWSSIVNNNNSWPEKEPISPMNCPSANYGLRHTVLRLLRTVGICQSLTLSWPTGSRNWNTQEQRFSKGRLSITWELVRKTTREVQPQTCWIRNFKGGDQQCVFNKPQVILMQARVWEPLFLREVSPNVV